MGGIKRMVTGIASLKSGMWITLKHLGRSVFLQKKVTEKYPHTKPTLPKAYRSAIKLIRFPDTNSHDCVGCKACERICPSACISVDGDKVEGIKKKRATHFEMDFALCSLCGLCLDVCPTTTLEYSRGFDEAGYKRDWKHDLLKDFQAQEPTFVGEQRQREAKEAEEKARLAEEKKKVAEAAKAAKAKAAAEAAAAAPAPVAAATDGAPAGTPAAATPPPGPEAAPAAPAAKPELDPEEKARLIEEKKKAVLAAKAAKQKAAAEAAAAPATAPDSPDSPELAKALKEGSA